MYLYVRLSVHVCVQDLEFQECWRPSNRRCHGQPPTTRSRQTGHVITGLVWVTVQFGFEEENR